MYKEDISQDHKTL